MKYDCDVIQDILPLYKDGICSPASRKAVEEHMEECPKCKEMLSKLADTAIDEMIVKDRDEVIKSQSKYFKRRSALVGSIFAAIFAIPILVCLIVNLATGHSLTWFFIVLAAMMVASSLIVVPLVAPKNRMFLTMTSFTGSLLLLLAVVCIYTGGRWYFIAATAVLFGLTVVFGPFIANRRPVNAYLKNYKGLTVMAADTITFYLMIFTIGLTVGGAGFFPIALSVSVPIIMIIWAIFAVARYVGSNGFVKAGIIIAILSASTYWGTELIMQLVMRFDNVEGSYIYSTVPMGYSIMGIVIGAVFTIIGLLVGKRGEE